MASKRDRESGESSSGLPPAKKLMTQFEPVKIGPVYSLEEMDIKVLQFQNRKLSERIEQRRRAEDDLRKRIEQLEQRQTTDDAVLCIVNRYWNQLDEDVRVLLQRFDAEGADEAEQKNESAAVTSFLTLLSQWDKQEIEDKLRQRVEFSERAIGKLLQAHDRLLQRKEKLWDILKAKGIHGKDDSLTETDIKKDDLKLDGIDHKVKEEEGNGEEPTKTKVGSTGDEALDKKKVKLEDGLDSVDKVVVTVNLSEALREEMDMLMADNKRLENLVTEIHQKHHEITIKNSELQDRLAAAETEAAELKNQVDDLEYQLTNANNRVDKLDRHLADSLNKLKSYQATADAKIPLAGSNTQLDSLARNKCDPDATTVNAGVWRNQMNEIVTELEDQRELATSRLVELEKLQQDHQEALKEIEKLKMDLSTLPDTVIFETTEYKCLQSQFSVLYNESMQMKTQLDEARTMLTNSKNTHLRQIEQMELEELEAQKRLRTEMIQMEDTLSQVRRDYDVLRIEFEQMLAANEQTGPINREMRNLISSLKNHNEQLKGEVQRYKRKLREALAEISKLRHDQHHNQSSLSTGNDGASSSSVGSVADGNASSVKEADDSLLSRDEDERDGSDRQENSSSRVSGNKSADGDALRELKTELKKSQDRERELKMLLDVYKSAPKEMRDKVQIMAAERKIRNEVDELRQLLQSRGIDTDRRRRGPEEESLRKIRRLEDTVAELQKNLSAQKQEEEAMLSEMEVTGQAFEDMQEQNVRLLQQLREKDDANFKLMSERIKSNQIQKLLHEEKDVLAEQVVTFQHQVEAQNLVVRKLEEKERILLSNLAAMEKELALRQQAQELYKRKAVESAQTAADLKLHLDKYHAQLKEAQVAVSEKTSAMQQQGFKFKRIQEELASLRKKLDRAKKIEMASSADEVLMEEIREYKEQLTCPSCKVKKKDAVLTKCFHVFCLECLKTRYETRQRKCPKCNATFGANDYHRIYLE